VSAEAGSGLNLFESIWDSTGNNLQTCIYDGTLCESINNCIMCIKTLHNTLYNYGVILWSLVLCGKAERWADNQYYQYIIRAIPLKVGRCGIFCFRKMIIFKVKIHIFQYFKKKVKNLYFNVSNTKRTVQTALLVFEMKLSKAKTPRLASPLLMK